jgi:Flp pilus assembly protein CpaB
MAKRSNVIVSIGVALFVVGAAATYLIARDRGTSASAAGGQVSVLYADKDIVAGTTGENAVNSGMVKSKSVAADSKPATALTDNSQLVGKTAQVNVPEGSVITADQFQQAQTRIGTVKIPPGHTALAIQLANTAGVAGFAGAGDKVDIYGVVKANSPPAAHLIMQDIDVLNVNGTTLAANPGQPGGAGPVFLLSVTPAQAERLVYLTSFEQLYFSLVAKDQASVPPTPGSGVADALRPIG